MVEVLRQAAFVVDVGLRSRPRSDKRQAKILARTVADWFPARRPVRCFGAFAYRTHGNWTREWRVVAKAEATLGAGEAACRTTPSGWYSRRFEPARSRRHGSGAVGARGGDRSRERPANASCACPCVPAQACSATSRASGGGAHAGAAAADEAASFPCAGFARDGHQTSKAGRRLGVQTARFRHLGKEAGTSASRPASRNTASVANFLGQ